MQVNNKKQTIKRRWLPMIFERNEFMSQDFTFDMLFKKALPFPAWRYKMNDLYRAYTLGFSGLPGNNKHSLRQFSFLAVPWIAASVRWALLEKKNVFRCGHKAFRGKRRTRERKRVLDRLCRRGNMTEFSRDPLPVFSARGHCEQFRHGQGCPLFDVVYPAFPLPTTALPTLQGALKDVLERLSWRVTSPNHASFRLLTV